MLFHRQIWIRKIIAVFLLLLLSFIYAEKTFHVHEKASQVTQEAGYTIVSHNSTCSICDFQLAKDAALPLLILPEIPVLISEKKEASNALCYIQQGVHTHSNRGPPVC